MTAPRRATGAVAALLRWAGILALLRHRRARRGDLPVLAFHRIAGTPEAQHPLALPRVWFEALAREAARRYRIAAWATCLAPAMRRGAPAMALTFDDGYREHAEVVWPILRRAGASGIFCLPTAMVEGTDAYWWAVVAARHPLPPGTRPAVDRGGNVQYSAAAEAEIARLKTMPRDTWRQRVEVLRAEAAPAELAAVPAALTWDDARGMLAEGAELAAHGVTHAVLTSCDDATVAHELGESRRVVGERTGVAPSLLAYPNGDHDDRVAAAARRAGYGWAFTVEPGWYRDGTDPMRVPRIVVTPAMCSADGRTFSWALFEAEILGVFDVLLLRRWRNRGVPPRRGPAHRAGQAQGEAQV